MTTLTSLLQDRAADALAWALVHFLWQGAALAVVAFAVMRWLTTTASMRYIVGVTTLALMVAAPVVTFSVMLRSSGPAVGSAFSDIAGGIESGAHTPSFPLMPIMLSLWMMGVALLSIRLLGGWMVTRRLVARAIEPASAEINAIATRIADRLELHRLARIVESSAVSVPVVIGWMKPVVLLPAAALSGLTLAQVESLLAHELAHVRRHDYLVNILQAAIETLLFYHPAVWWLSRRIRTEREHCCDDLAVSLCDRVVYVSALTDLATMSTPTLALAATDGALLTRVRRILNGDQPARPASGWVAVGALMLVLAGLAPIAMAARAGEQSTTLETPVTASPVVSVSPRPPAMASITQPFRAAAAAIDAPAAIQATPDAPSIADAKRRLDDAETKAAELNAEGEALEQGRIVKQLDLKIAHSRNQMRALEAELKDVRGRVREEVVKDLAVRADAARHEYDMAVAERDFQVSLADVAKRQREAMVQLKRAQADFQRSAQQADRMDVEFRQRRDASQAAPANQAVAPGFVSEVSAVPPGTVLPRVIRSVQPTYPATARAARLQGVVLMDVTVMSDGKLGAVVVTKSAGVLDAAAMEAVRQWQFLPATQDGKPIMMTMPVTMNFSLAGSATNRASSADAGAAFTSQTSARAQDPNVVQPRKIKTVSPVYPPAARAARMQGMVMLNAMVLKNGTVGEVKVTRSSGVLDAAAIAAVRQWVYEPARRNGQPIDQEIPVTVNFTLAGSPTSNNVEIAVPVAAADGVGQARTQPKVLKSVQPKYTQRAMDEKIEGTVTLQALIKKDGTVGDVTVMKSLDVDLDKAAIDSAKQWTFQPATVDGKPVDVEATLTMAFTLF